jgi:trigger factor
MQGLDLGQYTKYTGITLDALRAQFRPNAEKQVKLRLSLEKIAELEALTVSEDEISAEYKRIAEAYNVPEDQVRTMIAEEDIKADMLDAAALKFVKDKAVVKKDSKKTKTTDGE